MAVAVDADIELVLFAKTIGTVMAVATQPAAMRPSTINIGVLNRWINLVKEKLSDRNSFINNKHKPCCVTRFHCW